MDKALEALDRLYSKANPTGSDDDCRDNYVRIRAALEAKAGPVAGIIIPVDPRNNSRPLITNEMKAEHHGHHSFSWELPCIECAVEGASGDCLECDGSGVCVAQISVPWDTCKEIYTAMAKTACIGTAPPAADQIRAEALEEMASEIKQGGPAQSAEHYAGLLMEKAARLRRGE